MKSNQLFIKSEDDLFEVLTVSGSQEDQAQLTKAIQFALKHRINKDKLPYSIEVAIIASTLKANQTIITATILSDRDFFNCLSDSTLTEEYGKTIQTLVASVRKLNSYRSCGKGEMAKPSIPEQAERVRRMLLAMSDDLRAVYIKLVWRLQHLRILDKANYHKRHCVAQETLDIFTAFANRMGLSQLKWELEDLSFRYLQPLIYKQIAKALNDRRVEREEYIDSFVTLIETMLEELNIDAKVYGRPKHIYSIYKKMRRKNLDSVDQLFDLRAIRIITQSVRSCYDIMGQIHNRWTNIQSEYDDYIAHPKPNGYQSLHTVVYGPMGKTIEIQIRTESMHQSAELGVAAHWSYKEGREYDPEQQKVFTSLRNIATTEGSDAELLEDFYHEVYSDRVYVLTPKGEVMDLPNHSTPLDFAYAVHTSIGHRCYGAKVNGRMVPLTYQLKNAEQVQILTTNEERPKRRWLNTSQGYLRSSKARNAVRHWLRQQDHDTNRKDGLALLEREAHHLGVQPINYKDLQERFGTQSKDELLISLGRGDISIRQLSNALCPLHKEQVIEVVKPLDTSKQLTDTHAIQVEGVGNILINIANCCKPVPGDSIIGYITMGRGVSIHRKTCTNISKNNLSDEQKSRLVAVSWGDEVSRYSVDIEVLGLDRPGLLSDVTSILASEKINIMDIQIRHEDETLKASIQLTVEVSNTEQITKVLSKLSQLQSVVEVKRSG